MVAFSVLHYGLKSGDKGLLNDLVQEQKMCDLKVGLLLHCEDLCTFRLARQDALSERGIDGAEQRSECFTGNGLHYGHGHW